MVWLPLISVTMIKKLLILVLMLLLLVACHYGNKKQNEKSDVRSDTSVEGTWQGIEPFHSIDVSGVTKVVVQFVCTLHFRPYSILSCLKRAAKKRKY